MESGSPPNTSAYIIQASLERSNRDSLTALSIIRASIFEYERTKQIFDNISSRPDVTEKDKSHAKAQAARAKNDFEEARRTHYEVYKTCYQSKLDGDSQQEYTDEASTKRPHEDWMDSLPDGTEIRDRDGAVIIRTGDDARKYGEKLAQGSRLADERRR